MPLSPERTVAELRELQELTGDENGAQRVAWTDTWVQAQEWMARFQMPTTFPHVWDQATFNSAVFATKVPHVVLAHGYNAMVVKRNYRFRSARILHFFGSVEEQRGTLMEHLMDRLDTTGTFDDAAYNRSIRQGHHWGPNPAAWQLVHSRNYVRAAMAKVRRL